jgi:hypothetical protein
MTSPPSKEFGKRKPVPIGAASAPVKRSRHVALLLTGTLAVGGSAYALMPRENCEPNSPGMATPSSPEAASACASRGSSDSGHGGSGGYWSRHSFFSGDSAPSSRTSSASSSSETTRGGFGGFARSIAAHFSGS